MGRGSAERWRAKRRPLSRTAVPPLPPGARLGPIMAARAQRLPACLAYLCNPQDLHGLPVGGTVGSPSPHVVALPGERGGRASEGPPEAGCVGVHGQVRPCLTRPSWLTLHLQDTCQSLSFLICLMKA